MIHPIIEDDIKLIIKELKTQLSQLENKKILITGASGMIASYIVYSLIYANKYLFKKPACLYLVIRNNQHKFGQDKNIRYLNIDIAKQIPKERNFDFIIHAASKAAPKIYMQNMVDTLNSNILGLYHTLSIPNKNLTSLLFFSSGEIYGNPASSNSVNEHYIGTTDHLNKRSCYVEGKRAGETICMNYFWEYGIPVKICRIFHTFGPGMNLEDGKFASDFIKFGLEKKNIKILGDKNIKRPLLYIKDATIMLLKVLLSNKNGEVYNISNDKNVMSVEKFAQIVRNCFNKRYQKKIAITIENNNSVSYYKHAVKAIIPNITKFKQTFLYEPSTNIQEAVQKTIDYYLDLKENT